MHSYYIYIYIYQLFNWPKNMFLGCGRRPEEINTYNKDSNSTPCCLTSSYNLAECDIFWFIVKSSRLMEQVLPKCTVQCTVYYHPQSLTVFPYECTADSAVLWPWLFQTVPLPPKAPKYKKFVVLKPTYAVLWSVEWLLHDFNEPILQKKTWITKSD